MTLSTYNGYEYFEQDYEPEDWAIDNDDPHNHAAYQVEIMQGMNDIWITFKDAYDVDNNLRGRVRRNPSRASRERLFRVINNETEFRIYITSDEGYPIINAERE